MLVAVLLWGCMPLVVVTTGVSFSPLAFAVIWKATASFAVLAAVTARYPGIVLTARFRAASYTVCRSPLFGLLVLSEVDMALFIAGARLAPPAVASVLFESWPLFTPVAAALVLRERQRYAPLTHAVILPAAIITGGLVLVVSSQATDAFLPTSGAQVLGTILATAAAAVFSFKIMIAVRFGADIAVALSDSPGAGRLSEHVAATLVVTSLAAIPAVLLIPLFLPEYTAAGFSSVAIVIVGGVCVNATTRLLYRAVHVLTTDLTVGAIQFISPGIAVGLLLAVGRAGDVDIARLIGGVGTVVTGNVLLHALNRGPSPASVAVSGESPPRQ